MKSAKGPDALPAKPTEQGEMFALEMDLVAFVNIKGLDDLIAGLDIGKESIEQLKEWRYLAERAYSEGQFDCAVALIKSTLCTAVYARESKVAFPLARKKHLHDEKQRATLASKARPSRPSKHDWTKVDELTAELLASGKSERDLAAIIKKRLGVPPTTYREWRNRKATA